MPVPQEDEGVEPSSDASVSRARQWSRAALTLGLLFASLPLAGKLFLGNWRFDGALEIACLCMLAAAYLYFAGRAPRPSLLDSATMLDEALRLAASGATGRGLALLDEALRLDPGLWQAWEYRGRIGLGRPEAAKTALRDFTEAIRLAPGQPHLYILRSHVFDLLGNDSSARADLETAVRLENDSDIGE